MSEVAGAPPTLPPLTDLLVRAGFRVRTATRADCVCAGDSRMTVAFHGDVFYCHRCHRKGSRQSLARELGLLATDAESIARRRREAREAARLRGVADRLRAAERRVLGRARDNLHELNFIRKVAARLAALDAGARPRFLGEAEFARAGLRAGWCVHRSAGALLAALDPGRFPNEPEIGWAALEFVAAHEARATATYLVAAFSTERDRAEFALHPELRAVMVDQILEERGLRGDRGRWVELHL